MSLSSWCNHNSQFAAVLRKKSRNLRKCHHVLIILWPNTACTRFCCNLVRTTRYSGKLFVKQTTPKPIPCLHIAPRDLQGECTTVTYIGLPFSERPIADPCWRGGKILKIIGMKKKQFFLSTLYLRTRKRRLWRVFGFFVAVVSWSRKMALEKSLSLLVTLWM